MKLTIILSVLVVYTYVIFVRGNFVIENTFTGLLAVPLVRGWDETLTTGMAVVCRRSLLVRIRHEGQAKE